MLRDKEIMMIGESYLDGKRVIGMYMDEIAVSGVVRLSRVTYGGGISHHVKLDNPINVYGAIRDTVILEAECVKGVL
jgi:hypothetical protein